MLDMVGMISKKRDGGVFSSEEIQAWVRAIGTDALPDYQLAALLMAIYLRGMNAEETRDLTMAMANSGDVCDLSSIPGVCVDKHSTGGVGDTTTLVLVPLVAACGGCVAKMSGRGLGHTGGTLDKMESIPGMRTELSEEAFLHAVRDIGCAVIGQTQNLAPADKVLYALRDVTATVGSLPLIVSSVMSKKIAAGSQAIVLDVKTGSGALMQTVEESIQLAEQMVRVGNMAGRRTMALVTGMDQPLGTHIGNALEVKEAIDILAGRAGGRLLAISMQLGAMMLVAAGVASDETAAKAQLEAALSDGRGLAKLAEMIALQGGDARVCEDVGLLPQASLRKDVCARQDGYVAAMDTTMLGEASQRLGAGRRRKEDVIDPAVGFVMAVELGDYVRAGQPLATLHVNDASRISLAEDMILDAITLTQEVPTLPPLVYAAVRDDHVERF